VGVRSEPIPIDREIVANGDGTALPPAGEAAARKRLEAFVGRAIAAYARDRDRPAVDGTSRLSPYLRFGALSVRECVRQAQAAADESRAVAAGARKWIDELVWRDFYAGLLAEHPRVLREPFRREFARVRWNDDEAAFRAWCDGRTGYPIVDAGMRQLRQTGWMHNRVRMIVASFLCKDLLIDWRRGERHFMRWLADGDPASNDGGWQWAASTGTDAQPYFRIFNPTLQGERYDPDGAYVRQFVPELRDVLARWIHKPWQAPVPPRDYPPPIVDHAERRVLAVARYEAARKAK
jgi:deoxyribodipyrimidine photo-lyase